MNSTAEVLGTIAAISTFLENFPMSILDLMDFTVYDSIFDFLIDVLAACGVDTNEIIDFLLRQIYGIEAAIAGGVEAFYTKIRNGQIRIDEQNWFISALEWSIKSILISLLTSFFSCSAIPVLPNRVLDGASKATFSGIKDYLYSNLKHDSGIFGPPLIIPVSLIDPMNLLSVSPTSWDGQLYYVNTGRDIYYRKTEAMLVSAVTVTVTEDTVTTDGSIVEKREIYTEQLPIGIMVSDITDAGHRIQVYVKKPAPSDIRISFQTSWEGYSESAYWSLTIKSGQTHSEKQYFSPTDEYKTDTGPSSVGSGENTISNIQKSLFNYISVNDTGPGAPVTENIWGYLSKDMSKSLIDEWTDAGNEEGVGYIEWGEENHEEDYFPMQLPATTGETVLSSITVNVLAYVECERSEAESGDSKPVRVTVMPGEVTSASPEYIVCYNSDVSNPNTLYKTADMNAFIWYVLHKGMKSPQVNKNHMMWDSRISAARNGITRGSALEWNNWYASKTAPDDEFKVNGSVIKKKSKLYPVIQLEPEGSADNMLRVHMPSQRYLRPKWRNSVIEGNGKPKTSVNATIYEFNWDYLKNIQILQPKLLLVRLCEYLLGFSLSAVGSVDVSFTKKIIQSKLSSAIKSVIEANDTEVEDCYTVFSNDEVNTMMEEMLLSRYSATTYNGESSPVRVHDTSAYKDILNGMDAATEREGNITQINRLITEVTADPGSENPSVEYGIQLGVDQGILQRFLWAIAMPFVEMLFSPQVLLLVMINMDIMGLVRFDQALGQDMTFIINLILNAVLGIVKSIVLYIKDKIVELLLRLFYEKILPLLINWKLLLIMEALEYWTELLLAAIKCIPLFKFQRRQIVGSIDEVDYADIVNDQTSPQSANTC